MGYGTYVKVELYFSRQEFKSKDEVEEKIQECNETINDAKSKILLMQSGSLVIPQEWKDEPISWIKSMYDDLFETIEENLIEKYRLELLLRNFDHQEFDGY